MDSVLGKELSACIPALRAFAIAFYGDAKRADDAVQKILEHSFGSRDLFVTGKQGNVKIRLFTLLNSFTRLEPRTPRQSLGVGFSAILQKLPPKYRRTVLLTQMMGFSYKEAAEICDCPTGTIRSRLNRARSKLNAALSKLDLDTILPLSK